jgi:hypothetical protein
VKGFSSLQLSYCFLLSKSEIFEILERNGFVLLNTTHSLDMEWTEIGRNIYMTYSYLSGSISLSFLSKIFHLPEYDVNALINETVVMLKNNS